MLSNSIAVFDKGAREYDEWFDSHPAVFQSELLALEKFVPKSGVGIEVGVGTGRFAAALGIRVGVEPAANMREIAQSRGIETIDGTAEALPFPDDNFDFVLFVTTLCFVRDPKQALREAHRVLKSGGVIVAGIIDRESSLGKRYEKSDSPYYRSAHLISARELKGWFRQTGFQDIQSCQTLKGDPESMKMPEAPIDDYGEGGFVVTAGRKKTQFGDSVHNPNAS